MSRNNQAALRTHARRSRHPRPSPNANRRAPSRDEQVLGTLPYRKGHLTDRELTLFGELRGGLLPGEREQLAQVAETLRRPLKRLRALDLIRYWGLPLSRAQHRMLPWFAGLVWQRPLPSDARLEAVRLAHHLLCAQDVPAFLMEPFAHPKRYSSASLRWELCRLLATVGAGGGLAELCEQTNFWTRVPADVFERFLETPKDMPVLEGLIDAFVVSWGGPEWLAKQACTWTRIRSFSFDLPQVLRVVHGLCLEPLPPLQARKEAGTRLAALPALSTNFGHSRKLPIPDLMPPELEGWHSHELRTPDDFEAEGERINHGLSYYFQRAQRGHTSLWSLRRRDQSITVSVDVSRMCAWQITPYRRGKDPDQDPEDVRVLALWAQANGLGV